jgi:hypothetical protein
MEPERPTAPDDTTASAAWPAKAVGSHPPPDVMYGGGGIGRGHITVHLPEGWHRETGWMSLFEAACGPPAAAA